MSLPQLYVAPKSADEWMAWSFNHAANHYDWIQVAQRQKNQQLTQYRLDPMDPANLGLWLYYHQTMHNEVNAALGTSGYNLLELSWDDPDQLQEWLQLNGDEHSRISAVLGVG